MKERIQKKITEKLEDDFLDNMQKSYLRKQLKKLPKLMVAKKIIIFDLQLFLFQLFYFAVFLVLLNYLR